MENIIIENPPIIINRNYPLKKMKIYIKIDIQRKILMNIIRL